MCLPGALRNVNNRPVLLKRFNKGVGEDPVFVKRGIKGARQMVDVTFPSARPGKMFVPLDEGDVVWMAQQNCVDLNPWNARASDLEHPDELRLDLDPTEGFDFEAARSVAASAKELLDEVGLVGWPKTSGNRGIHIYVRLNNSGTSSRSAEPAWRWPGNWNGETIWQPLHGGKKNEKESSSTSTRTHGTRQSHLPTACATPASSRRRFAWDELSRHPHDPSVRPDELSSDRWNQCW